MSRVSEDTAQWVAEMMAAKARADAFADALTLALAAPFGDREATLDALRAARHEAEQAYIRTLTPGGGK